jgi:hypothetical protein
MERVHFEQEQVSEAVQASFWSDGLQMIAELKDLVERGLFTVVGRWLQQGTLLTDGRKKRRRL